MCRSDNNDQFSTELEVATGRSYSLGLKSRVHTIEGARRVESGVAESILDRGDLPLVCHGQRNLFTPSV